MLEDLLYMDSPYLIFSMLFAPLIAVIVLFKFQNQGKSAMAIYSSPITRNQVLATNALAGMILLILPLLIFSIVMIFPIHQYYHRLFFPTSWTSPLAPSNPHYGEMLNSVLVMSGFFLRASLSLLFYFAWYTVAATLSGNTIITVLLCIALPLLPIFLPMLAVAIYNFYLFGFYLDSFMWGFISYIHPVLFVEGIYDDALLSRMISYSAIIIALAVLCIYATNKRALEHSGDSIVFPYVKNVLVFILSVCGLLLMGLLLLNMFYEVTYMYIGFVIGFFIAYCIAQMIAEKTFNILNKMRDFIKFTSVAVGIMLLITLLSRYDILGHERYVPRLADIDGVQMSFRQTYDSRTLNVPTDDELLVKNSGLIKEVAALHQAIINERNWWRHFGTMNEISFREPGRRLSIVYKLTNGNVISRTYTLPLGFTASNGVGNLQTRITYSASLFVDRPELISSIRLNTYCLHDFTLDDEHIFEFVEMFMKDLESGLISDSSHIQIFRGYFNFAVETHDYNRYWLLRMRPFRFEHSDQSNIYNWLSTNGYVCEECVVGD